MTQKRFLQRLCKKFYYWINISQIVMHMWTIWQKRVSPLSIGRLPTLLFLLLGGVAVTVLPLPHPLISQPIDRYVNQAMKIHGVHGSQSLKLGLSGGGEDQVIPTTHNCCHTWPKFTTFPLISAEIPNWLKTPGMPVFQLRSLRFC